MDLTEEAAAGVMIVAVAGRLDSQTARRFSARLAELLRSDQPRLVIEASRLTYVSSAGFRALLVAAKSAAAKDGGLVICGVTAPIQRVMEVAGLAAVFEIFPSREAALAQLLQG